MPGGTERNSQIWDERNWENASDDNSLDHLNDYEGHM